MIFPATVLPVVVEPDKITPSLPLPEMTLRAAAVLPPTKLFCGP